MGTMKKTLRRLLSLLILSSALIFPLNAQTTPDRPLNPALPEGPELLATNPAGMGFVAQEGLGLYGIYKNRDLQSAHVEVISRFMGYNYHWTPAGMTYTLGYGGGWDPNLLSAGISWTKIVGQNGPGRYLLGLASRPFSFVSLGATVDFRDNDLIRSRGGIALRPLAFSPSFDRVLTLDAAAQVDWRWGDPQGTVLFDRLGATLRPMPGFSVSGYWNQNMNSFSVETALWAETVKVEVLAPVENIDTISTGQVSGWISFRPRETVFRASSPAVVSPTLPDLISEWPQAGWFGIREPNWRTVQEDLLRLAEDSSVKTVVFHKPVQFASGALAWEFGKTLQVLKARGKKIHWYLEQPTLASYVMAAWTADEIVLPPAGSLILTGLGNQQLYWKDFLATWGIKFHNIKVSPHKAAYDTLSESGRSPEDRETWLGLLKEWQQVLSQVLAEGRQDKLKDTAENLIAKGPFWDAKNAQDLGLIDRVAYKDEFMEALGLGTSPFPFDQNTSLTYEKPYVDRWSGHSFKKIGLVWFSGDITPDQGNREFTPGVVSLAAALRSAGEDTTIDGIVLRLDTGGGAMLASDLIAREITLIKKKNKPLFVSMAGVAGSGGYYIAAVADRIFATPLTLTGSIGVVSLVPDFTGLLEKQKINADLVASSPNAGLGSPFLPFNSDSEAVFRSGVDGAYSMFLNHVSTARNISVADLKSLAGGRLWSAEGAMKNKLIDQVGGLKDALDAMREKLGNGEIEIMDIPTGTSGGLGQLLGGLLPKAVLPAPFDEAAEYYSRVEVLGTSAPLYWMDGAVGP